MVFIESYPLLLGDMPDESNINLYAAKNSVRLLFSRMLIPFL